METDPIVAFYSGGRDANGRTLREILGWNDGTLEAVHDYIQWVFPTRQPSGVNPAAPLVSPSTIRAFGSDPDLRAALLDAFKRMLAFYGLRRRTDGDGTVRVEIDEARFAARSPAWLHPNNHNHLRLTRIMDSLSTLGLSNEARALQRCLVHDVAGGPGEESVSSGTLRFWRAAL
jgi:opioid growth factor receptor-like protein